ncbi:MAG: CAP domain-containing protein [bacterium]|nr:CAP domain-containing protein [bacterium]
MGAYSSQTEGFISAFERELASKNATEKKQYLQALSAILSDPQVQKKSEVRILVQELLHWTQYKLTGKKQDLQISRSSDGQSYIHLAGIDAEILRQTWLQWHNDARIEQGLPPLQYHSELERSATLWSEYQVANGYVGHKRKADDGYYNYASLQEWFAELGIRFASPGRGRSAFSESMGYRGYRCSSADCSSAMIEVTKKTFDAFMREGANGAHYKAIMMPHYTQMGVGFAIDQQKNMVYTTIHYAADIIN